MNHSTQIPATLNNGTPYTIGTSSGQFLKPKPLKPKPTKKLTKSKVLSQAQDDVRFFVNRSLRAKRTAGIGEQGQMNCN
jgi:hypothetical protein